MYQSPAWGVTANILVKRLPGLRFDTTYAKAGGGEDVDFCLRILETGGGRLMAAPAAMVTHNSGQIVSSEFYCRISFSGRLEMVPYSCITATTAICPGQIWLSFSFYISDVGPLCSYGVVSRNRSCG